ncbi:MAG TPA: HAMP domain-containing sensor histidine kinase, partial [Candidatus Dormibacteraeota bacterium]|nr:HAMP domain-containing sensor histidine kinase [Candidatus Dormibacteraeota bacterium]
NGGGDGRRNSLAIAITALAAMGVLVRLQSVLHASYGEPLTDLIVLGAAISAYSLVYFRSRFVSVSKGGHRVVIGALVLVSSLGWAAREPSIYPSHLSPFQTAAAALVVLAWVACVGDTIVRLWVASRDRPSVQRARLRTMCAALVGLTLIFLFSGTAPTMAGAPSSQILIQILALAVVPLFYVSFSPPAFVRRGWRHREEVGLGDAVRDLLLFSPSRQELGARAVRWAARLVGAESAFIIDTDGTILATADIATTEAETLWRNLDPGRRLVNLGGQPEQMAITVPLPLERGEGFLVAIAGPFTPLFGSDELIRLDRYATSITASLDRCILTERLAALEKTKSEFLNLASHELRGPITVLLGYLSLAESGCLGRFELPMEQALPAMTLKARQMGDMVEQMIEVARLQEGRLILRPKPSDLAQLAAEAIESVRPFAGAAHPVVLERPNAEVPVAVDRDRITTIISNLVTNAIKYSPEGGEVHCKVWFEHDRAAFEVRDHGLGIANADMSTLFTQFGRIESNENAAIGGTGLGLYLSRHLARMHGGDITAASEIGRGSTFVLEVPLLCPDQLESHRGSARGPAAGSTAPLAISYQLQQSATPLPQAPSG